MSSENQTPSSASLSESSSEGSSPVSSELPTPGAVEALQGAIEQLRDDVFASRMGSKWMDDAKFLERLNQILALPQAAIPVSRGVEGRLSPERTRGQLQAIWNSVPIEPRRAAYCWKKIAGLIFDFAIEQSERAALPETPVSREPSGTNRYGVDVDYFRRELATLAESLSNRPPAELSRYLQVLANAAADIHNHGSIQPSPDAAPAAAMAPLPRRIRDIPSMPDDALSDLWEHVQAEYLSRGLGAPSAAGPAVQGVEPPKEKITYKPGLGLVGE